MKQDKIFKLGLTLMLICLVAGAALAVTYRLTRGAIEERALEEQLKALRVVLPRAHHFSGRISGVEIDYYKGFDREEQVAGYAVPGEAKGYSSMIRVMVGVDPDGRLAGIKITEQKETPGLGTRAVEVPSTRTFWQALLGRGRSEDPGRPRFEAQFTGKLLENLKVVTGETDTEIQALTGATITSKAVTDAVRESLERFMKQQGEVGESREKHGVAGISRD